MMAPPLLAGAVGRMAVARARRGEGVDPASVHPLYVRRPDAEIARENKSRPVAISMTAWSIEPVSSPADIEAILTIEKASFTNPWTRDMYVAEIDNHGVSYFYVAKNADRRIVGFCSFWRILDELHINNLAVSPAERRTGVATALLTRVLANGAKLGARRATLEVRRSNDPARCGTRISCAAAARGRGA